MEIEPVGSGPSPRFPMQPIGITAELAAARTNLREATPAGSWDVVLAEVQRLQREEHLAPLAAMHAVFARLAAGWLPALQR